MLGDNYIRKELVLCPKTRQEKRRLRDNFDVRHAVHTSEYSLLKRPNSRKTGEPLEPVHKFVVNLEADTFTTEKFDVFLRYQMKIHKEDDSRWSHASFKRFLCSGLNRKTVRTDGKTQKLGSYHQCYRLDDKLIAVGVLDLLPHAVSSVYLFYDPDFEQFEFGKLSAMREIALAMENHHKYYYMGFYIHTCIKMRYKATFQPTYMLDPESLQWTLFDEHHRTQLDSTPYFSVSRGASACIPSSDASRADPKQELASNYAKSPDISPDVSPEPTDELSGMQIDPDESSESETEIPEGSLFDKDMPGVLTREEVEKLDLDHWKLLVRNDFVDLEVSR